MVEDVSIQTEFLNWSVVSADHHGEIKNLAVTMVLNLSKTPGRPADYVKRDLGAALGLSQKKTRDLQKPVLYKMYLDRLETNPEIAITSKHIARKYAVVVKILTASKTKLFHGKPVALLDELKETSSGFYTPCYPLRWGSNQTEPGTSSVFCTSRV